MRGRIRGAAALLVLTLALAWPGAAASAGEPVRWRGVDCATGMLSSAASEDGPLGGNVVLFGSAQLCPDSDPGDLTFAVATFRADGSPGTVRNDAFRRYVVGRDRPFGIAVQRRPRFGVCVLASPTTRIACAEINITSAGAVDFRLIASTDPLVAASVDDAFIPRFPPKPCNSCF